MGINDNFGGSLSEEAKKALEKIGEAQWEELKKVLGLCETPIKWEIIPLPNKEGIKGKEGE